MSWDADLSCSHGALLGSWNYTHNTNPMVNHALEHALDAAAPESWWKRLDGMSGAEGHFLLRCIVEQLEADADHYRAMNPENGWGDYDSLVKVLSDMRDQCATETDDTKWEVSG